MEKNKLKFVNTLEVKRILNSSSDPIIVAKLFSNIARINTLYMIKHMAPKIPQNISNLAEKLHLHGDTEDRMESRRAFAEKRKPNYNGWLNPEDRYNMPQLDEK